MAFIALFLSITHTYTTTYKPLLIILDTNQEETVDKSLHQNPQAVERPEGLGAMTYTLVVALDQQAAPVITNKSLIANILHHAKIYNDFITYPTALLHKKYREFPRFSTVQLITYFKSHCIYGARNYTLVHQKLTKLIQNSPRTPICSLLTTLAQDPVFNPDQAPSTLRTIFNKSNNTDKAYYHELVSYVLCARALNSLRQWVIKNITNDLCLLVPRSLLPKTQAPTQNTYYDKKSTSVEYTLGLHIDHLPTLAHASLLMPPVHTHTTAKPPLTQHLARIFVDKHAYTNTTQDAPGWLLYLVGHGTHTTHNTTSYIAGFQHHEFTQFLQALDTLGIVQLLCYASCYAGGACLKTAYTTGHKLPLRLSFTVLATTLDQTPIKQDIPALALPPYSHKIHNNQTVISGITPQSLDSDKKCLRITTPLNFKQFFQALSKRHYTEQDLKKALQHVNPYITSQGYLHKTMLATIASLRKPNSDCFTLLLPPHGVCVLDKKFLTFSAATQKKALMQASLFVFATPTITCPIYLNKNTPLSTPVCITRNYPSYTLKAVHAPEYTLKELLAVLYPLKELVHPPHFTITKLIYKKNNRTHTISDVHITKQAATIERTLTRTRITLTHKQHNSYSTEKVYM